MCQDALELNPDFRRAYSDLRRIYETMGDYEQAVDTYEKAQTLRDGDPELAVRLREAYELTGDILKADAEALVNTVICVGIMGRGIALQHSPTTSRRMQPLALEKKSGRAGCLSGMSRPLLNLVG